MHLDFASSADAHRPPTAPTARYSQCGTGAHVATGMRQVATSWELGVAMNDDSCQHIRVTEDIVLTGQISTSRNGPLVVEGACSGGTRGCTIATPRNNITFTDAAGYACGAWSGYCYPPESDESQGECNGHPGYITACDGDVESDDVDLASDEFTCEVGGYVDKSGVFYSKAHMDEVRSQCPWACSSTNNYRVCYHGMEGSERLQTRLFEISMSYFDELTFVGLTFDGGSAYDANGDNGGAVRAYDNLPLEGVLRFVNCTLQNNVAVRPHVPHTSLCCGVYF